MRGAIVMKRRHRVCQVKYVRYPLSRLTATVQI